MHGDKAEVAEAKRIIELVEGLEREDPPWFVVMTQAAEGTRIERAIALARQEGSVARERQAATDAWLRNTQATC